MDSFKVVIVIPAFNEEGTIRNVVEKVINYGDVIVVNDGSEDLTGKIAFQAGAIVITHDFNQGYDKALNSAFIEAEKLNYDAVITFDADNQHNPNSLEDFIYYLKNGVDLVLGVRPKTARVSELLFKFYAQMKFDWDDPLCGMKGYSMILYREQGYFDSFNSIGTELVIFGLTNNFKHVQLVIPVKERKDNPRFSSIFGSNLNILLALFRTIKKI
jgi:glycosyltransferase involved in cell wall biosynthesis|tara:strand:+ start:283 stop:927 length:645 start_codon:yes stop_codon:yes gene_type:complete